MMRQLSGINNQFEKPQWDYKLTHNRIVNRSMAQVESMSDQEVAQAILLGAAAMAGVRPETVSALRDGINQLGLLGDGATAVR